MLIDYISPTDFGTMAVTALWGGTTNTFVEHYGISLSTDASNNEVIQLSAPLLKTLQALVANTDICDPKASAKKARDIEGSTTGETNSNIFERDDGEYVIGELTIGDCTEERARWSLGNMHWGADGGIVDVIPANAAAVGMADFQAGALRDIQYRLNAQADLEDDLGWVSFPPSAKSFDT